MKFGVREICDVVFKAKSDVKIGKTLFRKGQPVLYIDTATTSTLEGASTTVYAQGGRGNTRLIAWEGEKTLTFTVEDALLSPIGFSILSGAGLFKGSEKTTEVHVHSTSSAYTSNGSIDLSDALDSSELICATAPIFVSITEPDGSVTGELIENVTVDETGKKIIGASIEAGKTVLVDYYVIKQAGNVSELQIDAENFAGYYYVEASTLFRDQNTGKDMPAEITIPNVKIQSNFTFTMAATGDPSTFTFTMDAFPGYTYFNPSKKVLCVIQVVEDSEAATSIMESVMPHTEDEEIKIEDEAFKDSNSTDGDVRFSTKNITVKVGGTYTVAKAVKESTATLVSADTEIASVAGSVITGAKEGKTTVTATEKVDQKVVAVITVNVNVIPA